MPNLRKAFLFSSCNFFFTLPPNTHTHTHARAYIVCDVVLCEWIWFIEFWVRKKWARAQNISREKLLLLLLLATVWLIQGNSLAYTNWKSINEIIINKRCLDERFNRAYSDTKKRRRRRIKIGYASACMFDFFLVVFIPFSPALWFHFSRQLSVSLLLTLCFLVMCALKIELIDHSAQHVDFVKQHNTIDS